MNVIIRVTNTQFFKYIFAGVVNTIFGYSLYAFLIYIGLDYIVALTISTIIGVIFNFINFGKTVFYEYKSKTVFLKFLASYFVTYIANLTLLSVFIDVIFINEYISQFLCLIPLVIINWFLFKFWVFR